MSRVPRIFVGSSTPGAAVDLRVRSILEDLQVEVIGWRDAFHAGDHPLDTLLNLARSVDAAVLILTPDEQVLMRKREYSIPRGNVLLELGIFLSQLGKHRAAVIHTSSLGEPLAEIPSDLYGITTILFELDKHSKNEHRLKNFVTRVQEEIEVIHPALQEFRALLRKTLSEIPPAWHTELDRYLLQTMREAIHLAARGQILLAPGQYYGAIYSEMDAAEEGTGVAAIASMSSAFWSEDRDQQNYLAKNHEAVRRGAVIRRLFVVPDSQWEDLTPILRTQIMAGIQVRRAVQRIATDLSLEDMVVFSMAAGDCRVYIADPAFDNSRRIRRARLILDAHERRHLLALFEQAWAAAPVVTLNSLDRSVEDNPSESEPAQRMKAFLLSDPVISCEEAAAAKCIPLENELKTLILSTSRGYVALQLPGDSSADLRAIKAALEAEEACLASPEEIKVFGLSPGTVCAVRRPVWDIPFLISRRLLRLPFVSTNDGTLKGFYKFDPAVLLEAKSVMLGDFERASPGQG